jgi:hypothetical protein
MSDFIDIETLKVKNNHLLNIINNFTMKDKRTILCNLRIYTNQNKCKSTSLLPHYGITAGEYAVFATLAKNKGTTNKKKKQLIINNVQS